VFSVPSVVFRLYAFWIIHGDTDIQTYGFHPDD
jgi:hypothetical protein